MEAVLGRVDKPDPLFDRSELGKAKETACRVVVACRHPPAVLEPVEKSLDPVASGI